MTTEQQIAAALLVVAFFAIVYLFAWAADRFAETPLGQRLDRAASDLLGIGDHD